MGKLILDPFHLVKREIPFLKLSPFGDFASDKKKKTAFYLVLRRLEGKKNAESKTLCV